VTTSIDALAIRRTLGRRQWSVPQRRGPDGWRLVSLDGDGSVIVSCAPAPDDGVEWVHASMTREGRVPSYEDLCLLHRAVFGPGGWSYQVFAPEVEHVNIHPHALHLWGRRDGQPAMRNFTDGLGTI
jgi:hypothetical protein